MHAGSKTDGRGSLTGGEDGAVGSFFDVFEDLRFGGTGVSQKKHVDISSDGMFAVDVFGDTAEEGQRHRCFDVIVAIDTWSN